MKKIMYIIAMLILCIVPIVGCDCGGEEAEEEKLLRLYDLDQSGVVDDWEAPYQRTTSRSIKTSSGEVINFKSVNTMVYSAADQLSGIIEASTAADYKDKVLVFEGNTYFERSQEVKNSCVGAKAYVVYISDGAKLKEFAANHLYDADCEKYIVVLTDNISFRTAESTGNPLATFGQTSLINLNGATLYGQGYYIEGFLVTANNLEEYYINSSNTASAAAGTYDTMVSHDGNQEINLKYSLISNATAVYDLNIYNGYQSIDVTPKRGADRTYDMRMVVDFAPLRNVGVIDNVDSKGKVEINTNVQKTNNIGVDNSNVTMTGMNISMLSVDESDECSTKVEELGDDRLFIIPGSEGSNEAVYDYDRIIHTNVTKIVDEETEEVTYDVTHTYGNRIDSTAIANCDTQMILVYKENIDASQYLRIGSVMSGGNPETLYVKNSTANMTADIIANGNVILGGAVASTVAGGIVEDVVANSNIQITSNGENIGTIGGVVGDITYLAQAKNTTADMTLQYIGVKTGSGDEKKYPSIAVGGTAGVCRGVLTNNKVVASTNISGANIVASGSIVGAAKNAIIVRNISSVSTTMSNNITTYSASVAGSAVGGVISTNVAEYTSSISGADEDGNSAAATAANALSVAFPINVGLLYFQSNNFMSLYEVGEGDLAVDSAYIVVSDSATLHNWINYAPRTPNNLVIDKSNISYTLPPEDDTNVDEDLEEDAEPQKTVDYLGSYINLGGYHIYKFRNEFVSYDEGYMLNVGTDSSLTLNGSAAMNYYKIGDANIYTEVFINHSTTTTNDKNPRLTSIEVNMDYIKNTIGFNGFDKNSVPEIELPEDKEFAIANIVVNNVYPGGYFTPNGYTDLQLNGYKNEDGSRVGVYADLVVDDINEELLKLVSTYIDQQGEISTTLHRQDFFEYSLVMQMNALVNVDNVWYAKNLNVLEDGNGKRYETDADDNLLYTNVPIYTATSSDPDADAAEDTSIMGTKLLFATKIVTDSNGKIYVFNKESVVDAPEGYTEMPTVPTLNPVEVVMLYRFTQVKEVEYIIIDSNINREGSSFREYSKLQMTVKYKDIDNGGNITKGATEVFLVDTCTYDNVTNSDYNCVVVLYHCRVTQ